MAYSEALPKEQIPLGCQLCESEKKIEWKCNDCNLFMCDQCKDGVHFRIAKDHKLLNIKEIGEHEDSWNSFAFSKLNCQDHPNQPCSLYCKTCSNVICLKCIVKVHNGHDFVDEEEFCDKKEVLQEGQKKVQSNLSKLSCRKGKMMAPEEAENPKLLQIKQNIMDHKKNLCKIMEIYADNLVHDANQQFGTLKQEEGTKIDKEIQNMHAKNEALESIIKSRDFMKFLSDFDKLYVSLNENMLQDTSNISSLPNFVPAEFTVLNFGTLEGNLSHAKFKVTNQWTTELRNIHSIVRCLDSSLWIADNVNGLLQHVKLETDNVNLLSSFNSKVFGLVDISSCILLSTEETRLKKIDRGSSDIGDSVYSIAPLIARDVHVTKDEKVVITARSPGKAFSAKGRSVVLVNQPGKRFVKFDLFEYERYPKPLFTLPVRVASTSNGNICVVDTLEKDLRGRVVVIGQAGKVKGIYSGHDDVNSKDKPFKPQDILATPSDNILVTDWENHLIHILNHDGEFISYYNLKDIGIYYPHSLALSTSGHLYIGCTGSFIPFLKTFRGKLYKENNAFFVITNLIETPKQTIGICSEDPKVLGLTVQHPVSVLQEKYFQLEMVSFLQVLLLTGECNTTVGRCLIRAWCPVENGAAKAPEPPALLGSKDFTVFIKNNIQFPKFKVKRRNLLDFFNNSMLSSCRFNQNHPEDQYCPIFILNDIVNLTGSNYEEMAVSGGVIEIQIQWNCNLDLSESDCVPKYIFRRLDSSDYKISKGYNFRYAKYYKENDVEYRTLFKAFGIKFILSVTGEAGKFNLEPFLINVGSGLAILGMATVICDIVVLYFLKARNLYKDKKYLQVVGDDAYKQLDDQNDEDKSE
ncbi:P2X purinoceptor 4 [Mytilus galloprovincialis]|uniref:P2X purinoceptor 4 n=1 Tax=Mytilus galloprovincialis TaxID=29158 RepID=A0A8B6FQP7_MYTGA|nr:P2X purinoceptor 4 [Mytilus galloprovincialis]